MTEQNNEKFNLFWVCNLTGRKHPAGVAFFNESAGDYRLKVDTMPEEKIIFLKPTSVVDGTIYFRIEAVVRKEGRVGHRAEIGTGKADAKEGYPVTMDIGPYSRNLVMEKSCN